MGNSSKQAGRQAGSLNPGSSLQQPGYRHNNKRYHTRRQVSLTMSPMKSTRLTMTLILLSMVLAMVYSSALPRVEDQAHHNQEDRADDPAAAPMGQQMADVARSLDGQIKTEKTAEMRLDWQPPPLPPPQE